MNHEIEIEIQTDAKFRVEVIRDGKVRSDTGWFKNLILNSGLNRLGSAGSNDVIHDTCRVGSGNTPPAPNDSALVSQLGSAGGVQLSATFGNDLDGGYYWIRNVWTFVEGSVVGNVAELGTGWEASGVNTLFSRALVRDSGGDPTTIPVQSDEILRVTWERRVYWPTGDTSGVFENTGNIGGDYAWTIRAASVASWGFQLATQAGGFSILPGTGSTARDNRIFYGGALGTITGAPTGAVNIGFTAAPLGYVADSFETVGRFAFALAQGNNAAGIGAAVMAFGKDYNRQMFQIGFTPALPKTADRALTFDVGMTWARKA